jgi:hypothetical protein
VGESVGVGEGEEVIDWLLEKVDVCDRVGDSVGVREAVGQGEAEHTSELLIRRLNEGACEEATLPDEEAM